MGSARVTVSDPERTILDALHLPRCAGGVASVTEAVVQAWSDLRPDRLEAYAARLGITAVGRRLGLLLETIGIDRAQEFADGFRASVRTSGTPVLLDPSMPGGGSVDRRWGVRVNIDIDEIRGAGQT